MFRIFGVVALFCVGAFAGPALDLYFRPLPTSVQKYAVVSMTITGSPEVKLGPTWVVGPDGARIIPEAHRAALAGLKDGAEWSAPAGLSQWDRPCVPSWEDKYWDQYLDHQEQRWAYKGRPTSGLKLSSVRVYDPR